MEQLMSSLPGMSSSEHAACHQHQPVSSGALAHGRSNAIAIAHGVAFALQGLLIALFLDAKALAALGLVLGFAGIGTALALSWRRWTAMPHWLDMCFSMCTVGCFGMYLGIWTDHRFGPIPSIESLFWTYGFMLAACDVGMFTMTRCHHALRWNDVTFLAMFIGGNLGMILGMKAGKWAVTRLVDTAGPRELLASLAGMSVGMIVGMMLGNLAFLAVAGGLRARVGSRRFNHPRDPGSSGQSS
jgi:hypothetical protein